VPGKVDGIRSMRPVRSQPLDTEVSDYIREMILDGRLAPGTHLVEADLAKVLKVSQGTVRSALRVLSPDGLLEYRQNRGVFVASFSAEDAWEVYTLRNALEATAAGIAAERITREGEARLTAILKKMNPGERKLTSAALGKLDIELHEAIVYLAGHSRLSAAYKVLADQTHLFMNLTGEFPHEQQEVFAQHARLVKAICDGQVDVAAELARGHNTIDGERLAKSLSDPAS
jgi:DNA-binding GntR family transcriptional regulator